MDYDEAFAWVGDAILDLEKLDAEIGPSLPEPPTEMMNDWLLTWRRYR